MNHIFVALIEVRPLEGCEIDPTEYDGAAVRCYIPAVDEISARALLSDTLSDDRFELVEEEFFVRHDLMEWQHPDSADAAKAVAEATDTGFVVYSEFRAWDHSDPDARRNQTGEQDVAHQRAISSTITIQPPFQPRPWADI
jgi:hypothetical protein